MHPQREAHAWAGAFALSPAPSCWVHDLWPWSSLHGVHRDALRAAQSNPSLTRRAPCGSGLGWVAARKSNQAGRNVAEGMPACMLQKSHRLVVLTLLLEHCFALLLNKREHGHAW